MRTLRALPLVLVASALAAQAAKKAEAPKAAPAPAKAVAPAPAKAAAPAPAKAEAKPARKLRRAKGDHGTPESIAADLNGRFSRALEAGDSAALAGLYTEAAELHLGKDVFKGRDQIKGHLDGFVKAMPVKSAKITSTAAHRLGNTVTDTGTFTFQVDDKGKATTMSGSYVQMLWRDKDGQWRLHRDWAFMAEK